MSTGTEGLGYRPCVGIMVINRAGHIWVGRRANRGSRPADGDGQWWQMPQGGIDEGESPRQAALRELAEETGMRSVEVIGESACWLRYDLPAELVGKTWQGRWRGQRQKWLACRFLGPDTEVRLEGPDGHPVEFDAWRWVPIEEIEGLIVPFKRAVYAEVVRELGPLARPY